MRDLWQRAERSVPPGHPARAVAADHLARTGEPLRVAVAGMLNAGKSTLVNALVGEQIAPTDARECTRVVTSYRGAATPRVQLRTRGGGRELPVRRREGRLLLDLDGERPEDVDELLVDWPTPALAEWTLIDTPGVASTTASASARTAAFVTPTDAPSGADAVVYCMRHLHARDVRFLEAFRDTAAGASAPAATVAVLSRADEVGAGRIDALLSASAVARRYAEQPALAALAQAVVPVAGLLAQAAATLRQEEFAALRALAALERDAVTRQLLSVDRFVEAGRGGDPATAGPSAPVRAALLDRFGVFGVRLAVTLVRSGLDDPTALAHDLLARSGVEELRAQLRARFAGRADALKARTGLLALRVWLEGEPPLDPVEAAQLVRDVERVRAGAHDLAELDALALLRSGDQLGLPAAAVAEAEALLGAFGGAPARRLRAEVASGAADDGAGGGADDAASAANGGGVVELRAAAFEAVARWRARAANPLAPRAAAALCATVVRSAEGVVAELSGSSPR